MSDNRLSFKSNPFEEEYLEKQDIGFSEYVHSCFYKDMKRDHYEKFNKIASKIAFVLIGCILLGLTYVIPFLFTWLIFVFTGIIFIVIGFISIFWEVRNERRKK